MTELQAIFNNPNPSAQELYRAISADRRINNEVIRVSSCISGRADSTIRAILILGVNTVKSITRMINNR